MSRTCKAGTLTYLGWSGFLLCYPGFRPVLFDPPGQSDIPNNEDVIILVTHGHPEHIGGTAAYLKCQQRTGSAEVFASQTVCRTLKRQSSNQNDRFHTCLPGRAYSAGAIGIDVFASHHMPFLPPERGEGLKRLGQIMRNLRLAGAIVRDIIRFPLTGPLLGFRVCITGAPKVLFYGEGLHRCTATDEVTAVGGKLPNDILITAVEPEDVDILPGLIDKIGAPVIVPYEAHIPWRQGFAMPCADLDEFSKKLRERGYDVLHVDPGTPLSLEPG